MTTAKKADETDEFERFEDALVDSILAASGTDLRDELRAAGEDPDAVIRSVDALLASAQRACAGQRLRDAQENVRAFRAGARTPTPEERTAAQTRLDAARAGDRTLSSKTLLAARNGQGATERDINSLLDDLTELKRLEQEAGENDTDAG
jgi:hypothetical protein